MEKTTQIQYHYKWEKIEVSAPFVSGIEADVTVLSSTKSHACHHRFRMTVVTKKDHYNLFIVGSEKDLIFAVGQNEIVSVSQIDWDWFGEMAFTKAISVLHLSDEIGLVQYLVEDERIWRGFRHRLNPLS